MWFGEWSGRRGGFNNRQVFRWRPRRHHPASGTATYAVAGLNRFNGSNLLSGTFAANFGTGKLTGGLTGGGQTLAISANINSADASFAGTAVANGSVTGNSQGQFFGANAATLAGIAVRRQQPVRHRLRRQQELIATPLTGSAGTSRDPPVPASAAACTTTDRPCAIPPSLSYCCWLPLMCAPSRTISRA